MTGQQIAYMLLFVIISVYSAPVLVSQSFVGNEEDGLQGNDIMQIIGWNVLGGGMRGLNICSGSKLFGGYGWIGGGAVVNQIFQLPPHSHINIFVQFWKVGGWNNQEFHIWVDDQLVYKKEYQVQSGRAGLCGRQEQFVDIVDINLKFKHTGTSAFVLFTSTLNDSADKQSWGFREFYLKVEKCPDYCDSCVEGDTAEQCNFWKVGSNFFTSLQVDKLSNPEGWQVIGAPAKSTTCGGVPLYGGFDVFGKGAEIKITLALMPHYRIKVKAGFMKIQSWDNEVAIFRIDNNEVWKRAFQYNQGYFNSLCGNVKDWKELLTPIEVDVAHTQDQANLLITTNLDEAANNEAWGIRDFFVFIAKCSDNCAQCKGPKSSDCQKCAKDYNLVAGECKPLANFVLLEQSFLDAKFDGINDWNLKNNKGGKQISDCGGKNLIGGVDVFGKGASAEKKFSIPSHKKLRLQMSLYKLKGWNNEWIYIYIDGVEVWKQQWSFYLGGQNICTKGVQVDSIVPVEIIYPHTAPTALVFFTSNLNDNPNADSWGFRDFRLFYEPNEECAIFYTECDFKGQSFDFCDKSPNFPADKVPTEIRSIKVPPQGRVTLYEAADYKGRKVVYTEDQRCIKSFDYSFLQMSGTKQQKQDQWIEVTSLTGNLRQ